MSAVIKGLFLAMPIVGIAAVFGAGDQISNAIDRGIGRQKDTVEQMRDNVQSELERIKARKAEWYLLSVPADLTAPAGPRKQITESMDIVDFMMDHKDIDPYESAIQDYKEVLTNPLLPKVRGMRVSEEYRARKERQAKESLERYHQERNELYNKLLREGKIRPPTLE